MQVSKLASMTRHGHGLVYQKAMPTTPNDVQHFHFQSGINNVHNYVTLLMEFSIMLPQFDHPHCFSEKEKINSIS